jgi:hypothetical protein
MCRAVIAVKVEPGAEQPGLPSAGVAEGLQGFDAEKEKARRLAGFGPSLRMGAAGFEPATPAV